MNSSSKQIASPIEAAFGSRRGYFSWILAAALALVWHAFWEFWLSPAESVSKAGISQAPWVSFLPASETKSGDDSLIADSLALWSPAVFSLPSAVGFSRAALTNGTGARPPLQIPGVASVFLDRRVRAEPEPGFRFAPDLEESVREVLTNLPERLPESPVFGSSMTTGTPIQVELSSGLEEKNLRTMDVPSDNILLKDKPWEVAAFVEFNEEGKVSGVFLETKSAFEDVDASLIRALWRWRIEDAKEPLSGRVMFRSWGRTQTASKPQSAGAL
jgi:hypothetical protein